jgi:hypothetical protein
MPIKYLENDDYWKAVIDWKAPRKWHRKDDIGVDLPEKYKNQYGIYRFESRNIDYGKELLYIGIAYEQNFDCRLHQGYHESKLKTIKAREIRVSVGIINLKSSRHFRNRYEEIEKLLIYFTQPKLNFKKKEWCPDCYFEIINQGYRGLLPKYIKYPVAEILY